MSRVYIDGLIYKLFSLNIQHLLFECVAPPDLKYFNKPI